MIGGFKLKDLVRDEIIERTQEGCVVPDYTERLRNAGRDELERIYEELDALTVSEDFPFSEPDAWDEILKASTGCTYKAVPDDETLYSRFHGAWLGRIVGCILGKPVETSPFTGGDGTMDGWACIKHWQQGAGDAFPPTDYIRAHSAVEKDGLHVCSPLSTRENITFAESDDDIRYLVLGLLMNEQYGNDFTACEVADLWHRCLTKSMVFTAEYIAMQNSYICEADDPAEKIEFCRRTRNPYREWIGAQIRVDHYGYYNAGDPLAAARCAYQDATFSHTKNGVYGAMFCAALVAAAFTERDRKRCVEIALSVIPQTSRLYADIRFAMDVSERAETVEELYAMLWERFRTLHPVHTNNNAAVCVAALLMGEGDFLKTVSIAVGAGWDTDCNGATVGSVMGAMLGAEAIPKHLSEPLHDTLYSSVLDFHPAKISECAKRTYDLYRKNH